MPAAVAVQDLIAGGVVLSVSAGLVYRAVKPLFAKAPASSHCGGCSACPVNARQSTPMPASNLVTIGPPPPRKSPDAPDSPRPI